MTLRFGYYRRGTTRRRPVLRWVLCTAGAVAGIGLGIAGSVVWPWGFAHPPQALDGPQAPAPGVLMMSADEVDAATVPSASVRHFGPPAQASGIAVFVRGARHGHRRVYVDCSGDLMMIEGDPAATWEPGGNTIADMIGAALCAGHPLLQPAEPGRST